MARRTKEDALATRARILDAAERLFQRDGVSRSSLHAIAEAAGVTRGAVYWHFQDKADLFNAMMERVFLPIEQQHELPDGGDPLERLRTDLFDILERTVDDEQLRRVLEILTQKVEYVDELSTVRERHLHARQRHIARIELRLREAQRLGQLPPHVAPKTAALGLHALVDGLIKTWMLDPSAFDLRRAGRQAIEVHLAGLGLQR